MKKWAFDGPLMSFAFDRGGVVGSEKNIFWICALIPQISLSRSEPHAGPRPGLEKVICFLVAEFLVVLPSS